MSQQTPQDPPSLSSFSQQVASVVAGKKPPLHLWNPSHCGDIDMAIHADGTWWHEGREIKRPKLVRLFASILRREADDQYYLVTPVEKCRVDVALHPLLVVDVDVIATDGESALMLTLNTGGQVPLNAMYPLALEPRAANAAFVRLDNGLSALFSRAAWYRLVEMADAEGCIHSAGYGFSLLP